MKTNFTLFLLTLLFINTSFAAKKTFPGYVITQDDQKIEGTVYFKSMTSNELKVKFKNTSNETKVYKAKELKEYGFEMKRYNRTTKGYENVAITYVRKQVEDAPVRFGTKDIMIQRKVNGTINIYSQFIEADSKIGGHLQQFFYLEKNTSFTKITNSNYKQVMKAAVADFPALQEKIGTKGHDYKYITKIAKMYNARFTNNEQPLVSMQD